MKRPFSKPHTAFGSAFPLFVSILHAMTARPVVVCQGFLFRAKEHTVLYSHALSGPATQRSINFKHFVSAKPNLLFPDAVPQCIITYFGMPYHSEGARMLSVR